MKIKVKLLTLIHMILSCAIFAQDGTLDMTFGINGLVRMDITNSNDVLKAIRIQPDGKILVVGYTSDGITDNICLARFNSDGTLDVGFGLNGITKTQLAFTSIGSDIQIQSDGKICVAGHTWSGSENVFVLTRYHPNGTPDMGFGNSGMITTTFPGKSAVAKALQIQNDGKIVLAGHAYTLDNDLDEFALARYTTNGVLDATFGSNGLVMTSLQPNSQNVVNSIKIDVDGKIVAGGFSNSKMAVVRYNSNGDLDQSFGLNGVALAAPAVTGNSIINELVISMDGSILGGGFSTDNFSDHTLVKFTPQGILDNAFGQNGISITSVSPFQDGISAIELLPDNKILASGNVFDDSIFKFSLARFDATGTLDPAFGNGGFVTLAIDSVFNYNTAMAVQSDGKIVTVGHVGDHPYDFGIVRYNSSPLTIFENDDHEIVLYPNPSDGVINIKFKDDSERVDIALFDVRGELIYQNQFAYISTDKSKSLHLGGIADGMYILKISTKKYGEIHRLLISR